MRLEQIHDKLKAKENRLGPNFEIVTPESGVPIRTQAKWMIQLLQFMYTEHGIAKSPENVVKALTSKLCRCWFILENGNPVAMTALVTQGDGSVELGRAVAISPGLGLGGIAMLRAGLEQLEHGETPLVAEVRVADQFKGIPSGEATQKILFGDFSLKPHALAPMFNHGDPVRQEMFALSTSQARISSEPLIAPDNQKAILALQAAMTLKRNLFDSREVKQNPQRHSVGFEIVQTEPFSVVLPSDNGSKLDKTEKEALARNNFALLPVEFSAQNVGAILECMESGWLPCGVDRNLGSTDHPVLLLGKLREGTLLAPIKITDSNLDQRSVQALRRIDASFRK